MKFVGGLDALERLEDDPQRLDDVLIWMEAEADAARVRALQAGL